MRKLLIPLLLALSYCLPALFIDLIPTWNPHSIAASQDKTIAAEVAAAIEEQKQEAANMARSQLADQKFQKLNSKARLNGTASVIVKLRVAFRPEGELLSAARVQSQRAVINQTQDSLMKGLTGHDPASLKRYEYTPYLAVRVNEAGLESLRLAPDVIDIHEDELFRTALEESVPITGAPYAWSAGYNGGARNIAILDTGLDKTHPFFSKPGFQDLSVQLPQIAGVDQTYPFEFNFSRIDSEACYSTNDTTAHASSLCPGKVSESTAVDSGLNCAGLSGCDHGTHVAGIAAGNNGGFFPGVAKGAHLISIQVFSRIDDPSECDGNSPCIRSFTSDLMRALERVYTLRDTYSIASVNMSLGSGRFTSNCDTNPLKSIIDQLRSAGIATVIASGDDGYTDAISEPACISSAISVGATGDGTGLAADQVASYSNSASFLSLLAPGDSITSSVPGDEFATFSGTSMAAPHVAGGWALLKARYPTASVTELLNYLRSRGFPITDTRNGGAFPRLNLGPPPDCIATNVPANHWRGAFYSNPELVGLPLMVRDDGAGFLNFDIGSGSPSATCGLGGIGADNFTVWWSRLADFEPGIYRFTLTADDGVELYIDGELLIANWLTNPATTYTADVFLSAGSHQLTLLYFEVEGDSMARLSWETWAGSNCFAEVPSDHWKGEYYSNTDLAGAPAIIHDDGAGYLNFDFGGGSPGATCGIGADNFSARWTRVVNIEVGTYRFTVTGDDGVRLYIDGQLKIDKWFDQAPTTYTADVFLPSGSHDVKLEYYENSGGAVARLSWATVNPNNSPVALCQNVTVQAGAGCVADASINNGSFDPDGDSITITQTPAGPYPVGATNVVLTVTDSRGATSQCSSTVTVQAPTTTTVSIPPPVQSGAVVTLSSKTVAQNCTPRSITSSVEFFVNNVSVGSAPVNSSGVATKNAQILLAAGSYPVRAVFTSSTPFILGSMGTTTLTVVNRPPVALCKSVTVQAGAGCVANASINDGSFDPDGDPLTITQTPTGPYPVGATNVVLTVTDSRGATSQCSSTVTVQAPTTTTVSTPPPVQYSDIGALSSTTVAQGCPAPILTGSVEFFINNVSVGSAPVNSSGVATKNAQILLAGGSYPVRAVFTGSTPFILLSMGTSTLTVTKENAAVTPSASNPTEVIVKAPGG